MGSCASKNATKVAPSATAAEKLADEHPKENLAGRNEELNKEQTNNNDELNRADSKARINSDSGATQQWSHSSENSDTSKSSREDEMNVPELTNNSSVFQASLHPESLPPRSVAFDVLLDENKGSAGNHGPHRLKKLENAPRLTAEQLEMKLNAAEEKRQRLLEKKAKKGSDTSRRRKELLKAREMDWMQQQNQLQQVKLSTAERNKAKLQSEIVSKQRKHDARVRRVRAKARQLHDEEFGDADFDVDHDERYNADSEDEAWSGDENMIEVKATVHGEPKTRQESQSEDENFFTS